MGLNINTLKNYANEGYNVLMTGRHGVGKTTIITKIFTEVFGERNVKWRYFSASTMDPWVDFIGVPKPVEREDGREVLKIIPPEDFVGDEKIEALFFDEINRADEKTLNAIMELIQFKSINGRKFEGLKCIWAAENPSNDSKNDYMVRSLDPAQKDRFQIQLDVPYELDMEYFIKKFGKEVFSIGSKWWSHSEERKILVSPRKLDDILVGHMKGFDIRDFTNGVDVSELKTALGNIELFQKFIDIASTGDKELIRKEFTINSIRENQILLDRPEVKNTVFDKIYPHLDDEVKEMVKSTFNYNYKSNRQSAFTASQINIIKNRENENKLEFDYKNVVKIKELIAETAKSFDYKDILENDSYMSHELDQLFPFVFDFEKLKTSSTRVALAKALTENDNEDKMFRDFFRIVVASVISRGKQEGLGSITNSGAFKFIQNVDRSCASSNTHYKISVTTRKRIVTHISNGKYDDAIKEFENNDLFAN